MKLKRPLYGGETGGDVQMIQRALNAAPSDTTIKVTKAYDPTTKIRVAAFQKAHGIDATGNFGQRTLDALWPFFDAYGRARYRLYPKSFPSWTKLGPAVIGGPSILEYDLTHKTSNIPLFPAVDIAFQAGQSIIAPEDLTVDTRETSSNPGHAFYATGQSVRFWFGHLDRDHPLGKTFKKGALVGLVIKQTRPNGEDSSHCHLAINVEALYGPGKQLLYGRTGTGPDYTHGSPTIGEQLEKALLL